MIPSFIMGVLVTLMVLATIHDLRHHNTSLVRGRTKPGTMVREDS